MHPSLRQYVISRVGVGQDYVAWLKAQHPDIQQGFLPFVGKNLVLFKTSSN